jgi:hypothetical protein
MPYPRGRAPAVKNLIFPKRQRYPAWIKPVRSWPIFAAGEDSLQRFQTLGDFAKESFIHTPCSSRIISSPFWRDLVRTGYQAGRR